MNINAVFVVWRESLEAMLVVGILHAWLQRNPLQGGRAALWLGTAGGLVLACGLGAAMLGIAGELDDEWLDHFQTGMLLLACLLVTHMVLWMSRHGRQLRHALEHSLAAQAGNRLGIALIVALAISREGAETVIFLYGLSFEAGLSSLLPSALAGLGLAALCVWLGGRGLRLFPARQFLRISSAVLLVLAAAMLATAIDRLIGSGNLPALLDPVWDSTYLLDDNTDGGRFLASFTGYRARPSLMLLLGYVTYWLGVLTLLRKRPGV